MEPAVTEISIRGDRLLVASKIVQTHSFWIVQRNYDECLATHDLGHLSSTKLRKSLGWLVNKRLVSRIIWQESEPEDGEILRLTRLTPGERIDFYTPVRWEFVPTTALCDHSQFSVHTERKTKKVPYFAS